MSSSTRRQASSRTRQRPPRRKLRASKTGNAAPSGVQTRRRQRWRNRYLRGAVWVFLFVFLVSVVGVIVAVRRVAP